MQNRTPVPREERGSLPDFAPVPRKVVRHDGWSPERQRAFIAALAETGSVPTACRMVNMAKSRAYALRHEPGAEGFRRAWDAALDLGLQILKDEAFDRALNGQLVPVFAGGKLMGYNRKKNDQLLMFLLRHYGVDANGRRVTINYFSTKATAGASAAAGGGAAASGAAAGAAADATIGGVAQPEITRGGSVSVPLSPAHRAGGARPRKGKRALPASDLPAPALPQASPSGGEPPAMAGAAAQAETSHTTMRTVITGPAAGDTGVRSDEAAAAIAAFEGVALDDEAQAAILAALEACAARARACAVEDDPEVAFVGVEEVGGACIGTLEDGVEFDDDVLPPGEVSWQRLDDHEGLAAIDAAVARVEAAQRGEALPPMPTPPWTPARALMLVERAADELAYAPWVRPPPLREDIAAALSSENASSGGPTAIERMKARDAACRVLKAAVREETEDALAIWRAARTEESWAAWLEGAPAVARVAVVAAGGERERIELPAPEVVPAVRLAADGRLLSEEELLALGELLVPDDFRDG